MSPAAPPPPLEDAQESTMEPQVLLHLAAVEEQQPAAADTAETSVPANTPSPAPHVKLELELQYDPSSPPLPRSVLDAPSICTGVKVGDIDLIAHAFQPVCPYIMYIYTRGI
eukprot:COSAG05_NODE_1081_length_5940_cov_4.264852_3_plen_112_part_00